MSTESSSPSRRKILAGSAGMGAASLLLAHLAAAADTPPGQPSNQGDSPMSTVEDSAVRPFRFNASDEALTDLRRRIGATK